jgi:predicted nuclease of predicted toxin-antitoxin system
MISGLFIELYLDEDMDVLIARLIQARGFVAATAHSENRLGATDVEQLGFASSRQMTLVTHNRVDFERLAHAYHIREESHSGLIIARRQSPYEIARRLIQLLNLVTADEMSGQVRYI